MASSASFLVIELVFTLPSFQLCFSWIFLFSFASCHQKGEGSLEEDSKIREIDKRKMEGVSHQQNITRSLSFSTTRVTPEKSRRSRASPSKLCCLQDLISWHEACGGKEDEQRHRQSSGNNMTLEQQDYTELSPRNTTSSTITYTGWERFILIPRDRRNRLRSVLFLLLLLLVLLFPYKTSMHSLRDFFSFRDLEILIVLFVMRQELLVERDSRQEGE